MVARWRWSALTLHRHQVAPVVLLLEGYPHVEEPGDHLRARSAVPGRFHRGEAAAAGQGHGEEELVGEVGPATALEAR